MFATAKVASNDDPWNPLYSQKGNFQNCAAFPVVFAYVFDINVIVCMFVIAMQLIAFVFQFCIFGNPLYTDKKTKIQHCAAFPLVFAHVFDVVCKFVIEMKLIDMSKYVFVFLFSQFHPKVKKSKI